MFDKILDIERAAMGVAPAIELLNLVQTEYLDGDAIEGERLSRLAWALTGIETLLTVSRENLAQAISAAMKANGAGKKVASHE